MPTDFASTLANLPASPPEAPATHPPYHQGPPVFDWSASAWDDTNPGLSPVGPPAAPPTPPVPPFAWGSPTPMPAPLAAPASARRTGRAALLAIFIVAALIASAFVGASARSWLSPSSSNAAPSVASDTGSSASAGAASGSSGSGSRSSSSGAPLASWAEVTAAIVPGVVDIESRVSGGVAAGTGMVLTDTGEILTNNHVVDGASQIVVTVVSTGKEYRASIVGTDPTDDVAVIQLSDASGLTTIPLGDSGKVAVNDQVAAIGNAGGVGGQPAVATGTVVALNQQITAGDEHGTDTETLTDMIQVNANVVAGDSGGPLANTSGQVIGMDTAASAGGGGRFHTTTNEAFAIPINRALRLADQLVTNGSTSGSTSGSGSSSSSGSSSGSTAGRGFLGVKVQSGSNGGAEIVGVISGSAADDAGLVAGDTIIGIDGTSVASADDLTTDLQSSASGDQVELTWETADGQTLQATVTLKSS